MSKLLFWLWRKNPGKRSESELQSKLCFAFEKKIRENEGGVNFWLVAFSRIFLSKSKPHLRRVSLQFWTKIYLALKNLIRYIVPIFADDLEVALSGTYLFRSGKNNNKSMWLLTEKFVILMKEIVRTLIFDLSQRITTK